MAKKPVTFTLAVDPSISLSKQNTAQLTAAVGTSAALALARLDLGKGTHVFVPNIKWPGGWILDLEQILTPAQFDKLKIIPDTSPAGLR